MCLLEHVICKIWWVGQVHAHSHANIYGWAFQAEDQTVQMPKGRNTSDMFQEHQRVQ